MPARERKLESKPLEALNDVGQLIKRITYGHFAQTPKR